MKVDSPSEMLSDAPTRVNTLSTTPIRAESAATKHPICAMSTLETNLRGDRKINENVGSAPSTDGMQLSFFQLDDDLCEVEHVGQMYGLPVDFAAAYDVYAPGIRTVAHGHRFTDASCGLDQLDDPVLTQVRDLIINLDIDRLTPIDALNKLHDWPHVCRNCVRILRGQVCAETPPCRRSL